MTPSTNPSIVPTNVPSPQPTSRPQLPTKQITNFSADTPTIIQLSITESFCATLYLAFISVYYDSLYAANIPTHSTSSNASNRSTHPICLQSIPVNNLHISRPVHHLNNHLLGHLDSQQVYQQSIYLVCRHINLRLPLRISLLFSLFHRQLFHPRCNLQASHPCNRPDFRLDCHHLSRHRIPSSVHQGISLRNQALFPLRIPASNQL